MHPELTAAIADHQAGRLGQAEAGYRRILASQPHDPNALHLLGVLASQQGRLDAAVELIGQALAQAGRHPLMLCNLANVLKDQGDLPGAIALYGEALERDPAYVPAHMNLADALCHQRRDAEAVFHFERALALDPQAAEGHFQLAAALVRLGRLEAARQHYQRTLELDRGHFAAANNLGAVCIELGDATAARRAYEQALAARPDCVEARFNLGSLANKEQQYPTAEAHFRRALDECPDLTAGYAALAETLLYQGRTDEARQQLLHAAARQPTSLIWQLRPWLLCPLVAADNTEIDEHRFRVLQRLEELSGPAGRNLSVTVGELADSGCHPPVGWTYHGRDELALRAQLADLFAAHLPAEPRGLLPNAAESSAGAGPPHLGFVVTAGKEGIFLRGMARVVDRLAEYRTGGRPRFRVSIVCPPGGMPACRAEIRSSAVNYLPLVKPFETALTAVRSAGFDLLYYWEIGSDALNYFLPMFRPAGVQCTSWGWPVTSGLPQVDYFVSSELLEPPDGAAHYREQLVRLQHVPNDYACPPETPAVDRAAFGLRPDEHVYFCGQSPRKIHPDFDPLMAGILRGDQRGVVVLISATLDYVTAALRSRFARSMPDVAQRVRFVRRLSAAEYRGLAAAADVVLDTPHYCGGANSLYDALAVAAPLVTLPGRFHRGRYTAAICGLLDLPECVALSGQDYVERAVQLASERDLRAAVRQKIRDRRGVLFENEAAIAELADFFDAAVARARKA